MSAHKGRIQVRISYLMISLVNIFTYIHKCKFIYKIQGVGRRSGRRVEGAGFEMRAGRRGEVMIRQEDVMHVWKTGGVCLHGVTSSRSSSSPSFPL